MTSVAATIAVVADSVGDMVADAVQAFNPPPAIALSSYPAVLAIIAAGVATMILLVVSKHFDPTEGALTISLLITLGMLGAVAYCLIFTIPNDDITPGIVGGLTAGFGAVVAHWLGRTKEPPPPPPAD